MKKTISILGSTGSIGLNTFKIINKRKNNFQINLLSANKNLKLISKQIRIYKPKLFIINDKRIFKKVAEKLPMKDFKKRYGKDAMNVKFGTATNIVKKKLNIDLRVLRIAVERVCMLKQVSK